jgi:hypothetical protein
MNHAALLTLVQVVCDHWDDLDYNDHRRREMLEGIYWLVDAAVEDLKTHPSHGEYGHAIPGLELIRDYAEDGWTGQKGFSESFGYIENASHRTGPLPPQLE